MEEPSQLGILATDSSVLVGSARETSRSGSRWPRALGFAILLLAMLYLTRFVARGWIPHDEGMLGQIGEQVLKGSVPHVDYQDPYTGGLSQLYAAVFRVAGVDLLYLRWLLFLGAVGSLWVAYWILRRFLGPVGSAFCAVLGLVWSFPNYFAGIPSWWLLLCTLVASWAVIRHVETGQARYLAVAGVAAGLAVIVKQTGAYLTFGLVWALLYGDGSQPPSWLVGAGRQLIRWTAVLLPVLFVAAVLGRQLAGVDGLYLFAPVLACAVSLVLSWRHPETVVNARSGLTAAMTTTAWMLLPVVSLIAPYVARHQLAAFINGAVLLPRARLDFAAMTPPLSLILLAIPTLMVIFPPRSVVGSAPSWLRAGAWVVAIGCAVWALRSQVVYGIAWQSSQGLAALLSPAICWQLVRRRIKDERRERILFLLASMLAWTSLNQFPYTAPIYFCYGAPLAVIAGTALGTGASLFRRGTALPWAVFLLLFAVLGPNREYVQSLGFRHDVRAFDAPLGLSRAHLMVESDDATTYRRVISLVKAHVGNGRLVAAPDCPEVYFLAGLPDTSGILFDFFVDNSGDGTGGGMTRWKQGTVVVLNHAPAFSPPVSSELRANLIREFPEGENVGRFEVRWR